MWILFFRAKRRKTYGEIKMPFKRFCVVLPGEIYMEHKTPAVRVPADTAAGRVGNRRVGLLHDRHIRQTRAREIRTVGIPKTHKRQLRTEPFQRDVDFG